MKPLKIIILFLLLSHSTWSQEVKELTVWDKLPNVLFEKVLNYPKEEMRLSDFKGKWVIFDFWSSTCGSCIELFPHMQELQEKFKNKLQIILVNGKSELTGDDAEKIKSILNRVKKRTGIDIKLPVVYDCKALDEYFHYSAIPHEVWIDPEGYVRYITSALDVTEANIEKVLQGTPVKMSLKRDLDRQVLSGPLAFENGMVRAGNPLITWQSVFIQHPTSNSNDVIKTDSSGGRHGMVLHGKPLLNFYERAYPDLFKGIMQPQVVVDVRDTQLRQHLLFNGFGTSSDEEYANLYSYELYSKRNLEFDEIIKILKDELDKAFNLTLHRDKQKLPCIVLTKADKVKKSLTDESSTRADLYKYAVKKYIHNATMPDMVRRLQPYFNNLIVDETGLDEKISIDFPQGIDLTKESEILAALKDAGFEISMEERECDVLILTDKNQPKETTQ